MDDLIAFLKESPDPGGASWCDERDQLIEEMQAYRDTLVYQPCTKYRLEWHHMISHTGYVDGKFKITQEPGGENIPECPRTPNLKLMQSNVRKIMMVHPLEELRLYYGSKRIRDIESWLNEV